ncbi:DUF6178 family protein [Desulfosarcina ovata]|uniref:Uncharacterized protein n=1 Tax=Desulfosarcina ovata subsp. ovata TaxID=2752305 RepID=A0A5K8ABC0_9BACT|nr:DUF6178 family protein [Desulfosarcina ovata]BBO89809.1 hypothetical protein DSCOOX_29890 [Desulfosarcina ovata subsp. ovata]
MTTPPNPQDTHARRVQKLAESRQQILSMPPEKAMSAILDHPQPAALVHSFTETDLHFLIHDIGIHDALPLIGLASNRQWEYFLDTEIWTRDQLDYPMATTWLNLLLQADPNRLIKWCFDEKLELMELYLFRNMELCVRESDQTPSDLGEGYFTDDDTFYVRFVDYPVSTPAEESLKNQRNAMLAELFRRLSLWDHPRYQGLLMEAESILPAETEEELFRLRNGRLAEKGFLPYHEAIGVYQPLGPGELAARGKKRFHRPSADEMPLPVPSLAATFLEGDNLFVRGLKSIDAPYVIDLLQTELASLCNQVITADGQIVRGRDQLAAAVTKVSGYLSIGLEQATSNRSGNREAMAAKLLQRHFLADLFRTGFAAALELHWQAERWRPSSWFQAMRLELTFWDEAWLGVLGGLLLDRPKFYDPAVAGSSYRDFQAMAEIDATGRALKQMKAVDALLERLSITRPMLGSSRFLTHKSLILTLWARAWLNRPAMDETATPLAIPLSAFRTFYDWLWTEKEGRRIIDDSRKARFLEWLADAAGESATDLGDRLGMVFEDLFAEIERELAPVRAGNLDPRFIQLFLLRA